MMAIKTKSKRFSIKGAEWVFRLHRGDEGPRLELRIPGRHCLATVWLRQAGFGGHTWHVWDRHGVGGENSSEPTIDRALAEARAAVIRWEGGRIPL